jgi:hypothetical protein
MAFVQRVATDLTGEEGPEDQFGKLVVRKYPGVDGAKVLDVLPAEVADLLSETDDVVEVEYTEPGASVPKPLVVPKKSFDALVQDMPGVLAKARGTRGRPRSNGS